MTEQDFLDSIAADPASDEPRLVYADWLMENGDPRGEFIRVQCELEERGEEESGQLERRQQELLELHGADWRKPIWRLGCTQLRFRRGFVHQVSVEPGSLSRNDAAIRTHVPLLDTIEIHCLTPDASHAWTHCLQSASLSRARTLIIRHSCFTGYRSIRRRQSGDVAYVIDDELGGDGMLGQLFAAGSRLRCHTLVLNRVFLNDGDAALIARLGNRIQTLRRLHVGGNVISDAGANSLTRSQLFIHQLRRLDLRWNLLTDAAREQLTDRYRQRVWV